MLNLNPQYLFKDGKEEFVILPIEEFIKIQELIVKFFESSIDDKNTTLVKKRKAGTAKHLISIPDDFYMPLDSFKEYSI